jgi:hypothetical protein
MIESEIVEIVHSNVENQQIFSREEPDFRFIEEGARITEEGDPRITEDNTLRKIE